MGREEYVEEEEVREEALINEFRLTNPRLALHQNSLGLNAITARTQAMQQQFVANDKGTKT